MLTGCVVHNVVRSFAVLWCVAAALQAAWAERRVALVIGNGSYAHIPHLPNVANDAVAMAALFKGAGFDAVDVRRDLGVGELRRAVRLFADKAVGADVAVVFYAGHGIEVGQVNYLVPVDAKLATDLDVEDEAVPLDRVLQAMAPAARLRLVLLDACRENPFASTMQRRVAGRSVGRGLARVEPDTSDTLIAYATKPNAIAEDGTGTNSPFTSALLKHLMTPGLDLRIALGKVRDAVRASTAGKQEPYVAGSLGGGILSLAAAGAVVEPDPGQLVVTPQLSAAERMWAAVKDTTSIPALEAFRQQYGNDNTVYNRLAEARIALLKSRLAAERQAKQKAEQEEQKRRVAAALTAKRAQEQEARRAARVVQMQSIMSLLLTGVAGNDRVTVSDAENCVATHRTGNYMSERIIYFNEVKRDKIAKVEHRGLCLIRISGDGIVEHTKTLDNAVQDNRDTSFELSCDDANQYLAAIRRLYRDFCKGR